MSIVAEAVTGAASSTFFDVLFDNLSSPDLLKIFRQKNFDVSVRSRLQEIVTEREGLKLNDGAWVWTITKTSRPPTSSLVKVKLMAETKIKRRLSRFFFFCGTVY
ncbi:hypothetical protein CFP56_040091 [Quercus suber]|uniref:Uncharacterized protein n=1 Tax=Quercus suber TaxID=58331 RepID=A0AAW0LLZ0_QUESU